MLVQVFDQHNMHIEVSLLYIWVLADLCVLLQTKTQKSFNLKIFEKCSRFKVTNFRYDDIWE